MQKQETTEAILFKFGAIVAVFFVLFFVTNKVLAGFDTSPGTTTQQNGGALPRSLVGKVVWTDYIDFDGRYGANGLPDRASWGYHDRDNLTFLPSYYPCRVRKVNVDQDGPAPGSVYCSLYDPANGWNNYLGWTSRFRLKP